MVNAIIVCYQVKLIEYLIGLCIFPQSLTFIFLLTHYQLVYSIPFLAGEYFLSSTIPWSPLALQRCLHAIHSFLPLGTVSPGLWLPPFLSLLRTTSLSWELSTLLLLPICCTAVAQIYHKHQQVAIYSYIPGCSCIATTTVYIHNLIALHRLWCLACLAPAVCFHLFPSPWYSTADLFPYYTTCILTFLAI